METAAAVIGIIIYIHVFILAPGVVIVWFRYTFTVVAVLAVFASVHAASAVFKVVQWIYIFVVAGYHRGIRGRIADADAVAAEGIRFADIAAAAAVCRVENRIDFDAIAESPEIFGNGFAITVDAIASGVTPCIALAAVVRIAIEINRASVTCLGIRCGGFVVFAYTLDADLVARAAVVAASAVIFGGIGVNRGTVAGEGRRAVKRL
jgi:hypothetical protein